MSGGEIRKRFLNFFATKNHNIVGSAPLVPINDATLLWINCGMAPLKKYFDGREVPGNPRIANSQKSIRTNDIENVGRTARHHTFFEMLGNFSIGDYFKKEAIEWAWEFLTVEMALDIDNLSVTIHPEDEEAYMIWKEKIGVSEHRIVRLKENFWDIGEGPCGPNTEIFYDRGERFACDDPNCQAGCECDRYLEVWNLVFSQYNHNPDGSYTPLPKKNIDTGMGLERMASVLQDVDSNYETDLLYPVITATADKCSKAYKQKKEWDVAFNVIADHARTVTFAVAESVLPSNEGRGYVIRRLLRRAVRFGKVLGLEKPFLYELAPVVAKMMSDYYPELQDNMEFVQKVIKSEEERFHETLEDGLQILQSLLSEYKQKGISELDGATAFKLYDTYGFPIDLTEDIAEENSFTLDKSGFEACMQEQRDRARKARQDDNSMQVQGGDITAHTKPSEFIGYDLLTTETVVDAIFIEKKLVDSVDAGTECQVILERTPFYAESGGQINDIGMLTAVIGLKADVLDVQKGPNGQSIHRVKVKTGKLVVGAQVIATVDAQNRQEIVKNHTATHLLHKALKQIIGQHVNQAGSLVAAERLRFDFSHLSAVTKLELQAIEDEVNRQIWASASLTCQLTDIENAKKMGAMALFGEKYGDTVRVVTVGDYSMELCGGCHVNNTAEIGLFKIISESGIGAGVRRIEACTGQGAYQWFNERNQLLETVAATLKTKTADTLKRVQQLLDEGKIMQRELEAVKSKLGSHEAGNLLNRITNVQGVHLLAQVTEPVEMKELLATIDELKQKIDTGVVVLGSVKNDKVSLAAYVTKDLVKKGVHAGNMIKEVAAICGGGGGGRPDMAQAGGKDPAKVAVAIASVEKILKAQLQAQ